MKARGADSKEQNHVRRDSFQESRRRSKKVSPYVSAGFERSTSGKQNAGTAFSSDSSVPAAGNFSSTDTFKSARSTSGPGKENLK